MAIIAISSNIYAYDLTPTDNALVTRATSRIEAMVQKKWEPYRDRIVKPLEAQLKKLKKDSRIYALLNKTLENIRKKPETKPVFQAPIIGKLATEDVSKLPKNDYDPALFDKGSGSSGNDSSISQTSASLTAKSWNAELVYDAISGGKTSRDIANGSVRFDSSTLTKDMMLSALNRMRSDYGLLPLAYNESLAKAAKSHSEYARVNGISEGHYETSSKSGFVGSTPWDRTAKFGYSEDNVSEDIAFVQGDIATALRWLMEIPYHRTGFLEDNKDIGFCLEKGCYGVFVLGGKQSSNVSRFVFPKNGKNVYNYGSEINETPNPFPWMSARGLVITVWDAQGVDKNSVRFVDVTEDRTIPVSFADSFSPVGQDGLTVTVKKAGDSSTSRTQSALHFINRESLKEGHAYITEYSTTNVGDNLCTIHRSYFVAGNGTIPDVSKLLPTESSVCGNFVPKVQQQQGTTSTTQTPESDAWAIEVTGDVYIVSQKYGTDPEFSVFTYTDDTKKRNYTLAFSDSDMAWLLSKKQSTGQTPPTKEITGMYTANNVKIKIFSVRKMQSYGNPDMASAYESYSASASVVR